MKISKSLPPSGDFYIYVNQIDTEWKEGEIKVQNVQEMKTLRPFCSRNDKL